MEIVFASVQCSEQKFNMLFKESAQKPGQQVQKFNRLLAEGLATARQIELSAVSAIPFSQKTNKKIIWSKSEEEVNGIKYYYLFCLNIHRVKDILNAFSSFFQCVYLGIKKKQVVYMCDILNAPVSFGAMCASRCLRKRCIGIVTDLPSLVYKERDRAYRYVSNIIIRKCTDYILLTEQMNEVINEDNKPYVVIEGIVDNVVLGVTEKKNQEKRVCMYTGTIDRKYGISILVDAFIMANIEDAELHIYGDGDYRDELEERCAIHSNIKYFGVKMNEYIVAEQRKATVLINPRISNEEFTKYSFPSKNMEYMLSGTPTIVAKLPGMPDEYDDYLHIVKKETVEGFCEMLTQVLSESDLQLYEEGKMAQEFVLREKNKKKQGEKIIKSLNII